MILVGFYLFQRSNGHCGWEVIYVATVEPLVYLITIGVGKNAAIMTLANGEPLAWIRYAGKSSNIFIE